MRIVVTLPVGKTKALHAVLNPRIPPWTVSKAQSADRPKLQGPGCDGPQTAVPLSSPDLLVDRKDLLVDAKMTTRAKHSHRGGTEPKLARSNLAASSTQNTDHHFFVLHGLQKTQNVGNAPGTGVPHFRPCTRFLVGNTFGMLICTSIAIFGGTPTRLRPVSQQF